MITCRYSVYVYRFKKLNHIKKRENNEDSETLDSDCRCGDSYGGRVCPDVTVLQHDPGLVLLLLLRFLHQRPTVGLV